MDPRWLCVWGLLDSWACCQGRASLWYLRVRLVGLPRTLFYSDCVLTAEIASVPSAEIADLCLTSWEAPASCSEKLPQLLRYSLLKIWGLACSWPASRALRLGHCQLHCVLPPELELESTCLAGCGSHWTKAGSAWSCTARQTSPNTCRFSSFPPSLTDLWPSLWWFVAARYCS